jgi:hypothetical protein
MTNREFIAQNKSAKDKIKVLGTMNIGTTPVGSKELNIWDKRRWLILEDYWMGHISQEYANEKLAQVTYEERRARAH